MSKATISVSVSNFDVNAPEFKGIAQTAMKLLRTLDYDNSALSKVQNHGQIETRLVLSYLSDQSYETLLKNMKSLHEELIRRGKFTGNTQVVFSLIRHADEKEQKTELYKRTDVCLIHASHQGFTIRELNDMLAGYKHGAPTIDTVVGLHLSVEVAHRQFDFDLGI